MLGRLAHTTYQFLKRASYWLAGPLLRASTIDTYYRVGYWLFALAIVATVGYAVYAGFDELLILDNALLEYVVRAAAALLRVPDPQPAVPYPFTVLFLLAIGGLVRPIRDAIGRATINLLIWTANRLVNLGEACVEHRSAALLAIALLGLVVGNAWMQRQSREIEARLTAQDLSTWLADMESFVLRTPLTTAESQSFQIADRSWRDGIPRVLPRPTTEQHPAIRLRELLSAVHAPSSLPWEAHLRDAIDDFVAAPGSLRRPPAVSGEAAFTTYGLIRITLGRAYMRLAGDRCEDEQAIQTGLEHYEAASTGPYRAEAENGIGTVYTCAFISHLDGNAESTEAAPAQICRSATDCITRAREAYVAAAEGVGQCEFLDLRRRNNLADLLARVVFNFEDLRPDFESLPSEYQFRDGPAMRTAIDDALREVLRCVGRGDFIPTVYVTASQGLAVQVPLATDPRRKEGLLRAAGLYLRMAYAFESGSFESWNLDYFCSVLAPDRSSLLPDFVHGFQDTHPGMETMSADALLTVIASKCEQAANEHADRQ